MGVAQQERVKLSSFAVYSSTEGSLGHCGNVRPRLRAQGDRGSKKRRNGGALRGRVTVGFPQGRSWSRVSDIQACSLTEPSSVFDL